MHFDRNASRTLPAPKTKHLYPKPYSRPPQETPLRLWMEREGVYQTTLALALGVSQNAVQMWATGRVVPNLVVAFKIERYTRGAVPVSSWLGTKMALEEWGDGVLGVHASEAALERDAAVEASSDRKRAFSERDMEGHARRNERKGGRGTATNEG